MRYALSFLVPESHLNIVKEAIFAAGAGQLGPYSHCAWQVLGEGQFKPLEGSKPFIGSQGVVERVQEYRVETVCDAASIKSVISALKLSHPYEVPAYQVVVLEDF